MHIAISFPERTAAVEAADDEQPAGAEKAADSVDEVGDSYTEADPTQEA